jgi:hypothetical protein
MTIRRFFWKLRNILGIDIYKSMDPKGEVRKHLRWIVPFGCSIDICSWKTEEEF